MKRLLLSLAYWLGTILFWELLMHLSASLPLSRALPMVGFSLAVAALLTALTGLPGRAGRILFWILPPALFLVYAVQIVYEEIFGSLLSMAFVSMGGEAITAFWGIAIAAIGRKLLWLLAMLVPVVGSHILRRRFEIPAVVSWRQEGALVLSAAAVAVGTWAALPLLGSGAQSPAALFANSTATVDRWAEQFGILTAELLDLRRQGSAVSGSLSEQLSAPVDLDEGEEETQRNILPELDFDVLASATDDQALQSLTAYFSTLSGTAKNDYTGYFAGYNLIVVCAEAFSNYLIDPDLTPTLYRMSQEGFVFENFYNSFPNLTTNGEYALCMGLMPDMSRMSFAVSMENYLPFCLGHIYADQGLPAYAYHNNVGTFYNRVNTHTNMGYTFKALDFGLDMEPGTPTSDLEMMEKTVDDYLQEPEFHAYYMTYSGHADYNFTDNAMSIQNEGLVADLPGSETLRAYIACQLELEKAMTYLLQRLEEAGIAERTVVVLTGDHMPYGLTEEDYAALAGDATSEPFWQYRNSFLCWNGGMDEPVVVVDYCCTQDILPTLLNLFGFSYDSRLLTGRDVLAPGEHLAVLKDGSFLTDGLVYNASTGQATWSGQADENRLNTLIQAVNNEFLVASSILGTDYYGFAFETLGLAENTEPSPTYASYADIAGKWYEDAVETLTRYGALSGGGTGAFSGENAASRADFTAMLARSLAGQEEETGTALPYDDVEAGQWYYEPISHAWNAGWLAESDTFRPLDKITQAEAQEILDAAAAAYGLSRSWTEACVAEAMEAQAASGLELPEGQVSRGAAASMAAALVEEVYGS